MNRGPALAAAGVVTGIALAAVTARCLVPDSSPATWPPATPVAEQCGSAPAQASRVVVDAPDDFELGAAVVTPARGPRDGPVVVLRHGASHTLCDWLSWAAETSDATGATVLLMDRRGQGSSPGRTDLSRDPADVGALFTAVGDTAEDRALVVIGSSMGNASAFSLFEHLPRRPCTVVALSPVPASGPLDGVAALRSARSQETPHSLHLVWAADDANVPEQATALADAARSRELALHTHEVPGSAHARAVLDQHRSARQFVEKAVTSCR